MASFICLLGLCSLAVTNPVVSTTNDVTANVTTDVTINNAASAHIPLGTNYVGCYREATGTRALSRATLTHPRLTIGVCQDFCKGYRYCMLDTRRLFLSLWFGPIADMPALQTALSTETSVTVDIASTIQRTRSLTAAVLFPALAISLRHAVEATCSAFTNRTSRCRCPRSITLLRAAIPNPRIRGLSTGSSAQTRYVSHPVTSSSSCNGMTEASIR